MKKVLMIAAAALAVTSANAASMSGFKVGAHGGYGFGKLKNNYTETTAGTVTDRAHTNINVRGMLYGLHLGYNHDFGKFVAGLETHATFSNADGSKKVEGDKWKAKRKNAYGIALRAGYKVTESTLLGVKAGFDTVKFHSSAASATKISKRHAAFVPGVFVEKMLNDHVSVGAEYSYLMGAKNSRTDTIGNTKEKLTIKPRSHDFMVKVGYKF